MSAPKSLPPRKSPPALYPVMSGIYDAALQPAIWPEVIQEVAAYCRAPFAMISWRDRDASPDPHTFRLETSALRVETNHSAMLDEYYRGPVFRDPVIQMLQGPVDIPKVNDELIPREQFENSKIYKRFYRPLDVVDRACVLVVRGSCERNATLTVCRTSREGRFDEESLKPLRELSPHVRRALNITHRFRRANERQGSLLSVVDQIGEGVFFLDGAHRVVFANAAAEQAVQRGVLAVRRGRLRAATAADSLALELLLAKALGLGIGGGHAGGSLPLRGSDGAYLATLSVSPLRMPMGGERFGARPVRAVVFVREKGSLASGAPECIQAWFGLTAAETRIATGLARGLSLQQIADRQQLSKETIRTQLRGLFDKTGVRRQSELVKILLTIPGTEPRN